MITKKDIRKEIEKASRNVTFAGRMNNIAEAVARRVALEELQPVVYYVQTTNATPVNIHVIEIADDEAGMITVELLAIKTDGTVSSAIKQIHHYIKTAGALTVNSMWDLFQNDLVVTLTVGDDGSDNIKIQVTGVAATNIDWECYITQRKIIATALP